MGQVWRGYDGVLDREVAVKLIRPDVVFSAEQAEELAKRFRREARVTARIQHHGVPQVFDAVLDSAYDRLYLVMEYVRGTSLRAYIDPTRPLPVDWAAAITAQICTVLSHGHAIPVVHRDLKPDNVLVTIGGEVKVLDFGIAAILRTDVTRLTTTGSLIGTHRYMPPEQVQGGQISPQSDLYALGCVLHELLAGTAMFDGRSEFELMRQHVEQSPQPLRQIRADIPVALESLVLDLTANDLSSALRTHTTSTTDFPAPPRARRAAAGAGTDTSGRPRSHASLPPPERTTPPTQAPADNRARQPQDASSARQRPNRGPSRSAQGRDRTF